MSERGSDFGHSGTTVVWFYARIVLATVLLLGLLEVSSHASSPSLPSGLDLRAGSRTRRIQEHPERPPSQRERPGRPRQIQDPATDQAGQHQAEDRRVRGLIKSLFYGRSPFLNGHYISLLGWRTQTHTQTYVQQPHISCRPNWSTAEASLTERHTPVVSSSGSLQILWRKLSAKTFPFLVFHILFVYFNVCNLINSDQIIIVFIQRCDDVAGLAKFYYYYFMMCTYDM